MKKLVIAAIVVTVLVGGIFGLSRFRMASFLDGEKEEVIRGDLLIPVTASGTVEPDEFILIKSKASGEVVEIMVVAGQLVRKGDVLLKLDPVDERRNVELAQAGFDRLQSALNKAQINLENAKRDLPLQTKLAKARLDDATARLTEAEYRWDKVKGYIDSGAAGSVEGVSTRANYEVARAAKEMAETELSRARNNEEIVFKSTQSDVEQARSAHETAAKDLEEAKLRLEETTVRAPTDAMVYSVDVTNGVLVQSGKTSLTGGTPLMVLADTSSMFVMAQVDEADIGEIRRIAPDYAKPGQTRKLDRDEAMKYARRILDAAEAEKIVNEAEETQNLLGRPVEVTVEAYRAESYKGVIERILPEPETLSNVITFRVRIRLMGSDLEKLLGLQADLEFTTEKLHNVVLVKNDALHSEGRDCFVFIPKKFSESGPMGEEKRPVKIGKTDGTFTQIINGVKDGEYVWTKRPKLTEKEQKAQEAA